MLKVHALGLVLQLGAIACGKAATSLPNPEVGGTTGGGPPTTAEMLAASDNARAAGAATAGSGADGTNAGTAGANSASAAGPRNGGRGNTAGARGSPFPDGVIQPRIMIVGDSISAGPGCYKKYLLKNLTDNRYAKLEFVGEYDDDCGGGVRHSAVSCSTAEQYTQPTFMLPNCSQDKTFPGLSTLMPKHKPDLLMLQLGVNDVWSGRSTEQTLADYEKLVEQARAANPNIVLAVARIQKIRPGCGADDSIQRQAEALVNAVPTWAQKLSTASSPIFVADLWTSSDWSKAETLDCVHPNDMGAMRMGLNWYDTLKTILRPD